MGYLNACRGCKGREKKGLIGSLLDTSAGFLFLLLFICFGGFVLTLEGAIGTILKLW